MLDAMLDAGYWSERSGDPENSGILDGEDLFPYTLYLIPLYPYTSRDLRIFAVA
jgi:hypothetical protein